MSDDHDKDPVGWRGWSSPENLLWRRIEELARQQDKLRDDLEEIRMAKVAPEERAALLQLRQDWDHHKEDFSRLKDMVKSYERSKWLRGIGWQILLGAGATITAIWALREPAAWVIARLFQ